MKKKFTNMLSENLVFWIMLLVGLSFCLKRTAPFIAADAYRNPSEEKVYVTEGSGFEEEILLTSEQLYGFCLKLEKPEIPEESVSTTITITSDEETIFSRTVSGSGDPDAWNEIESIAEYDLDGVRSIAAPMKYQISITSDAPSQEYAYGYVLDEDGKLWFRGLYQLLSFPQRVAVSGLFILLFTILLYGILVRTGSLGKGSMRKPENVFLVAALFLGLLYLIILPVFKVPDSVNHYVRAYEITKGYFLIPQGGIVQIPYNLVPYPAYTFSHYVVANNAAMTIDPVRTIDHDIVNMALYSPISYVLQAVGIGAADLFSDNTYILYYAGSLANLLGCVLILYKSIKAIPYGKWILTYLSLLPMIMQERSSLAVDALTFSMAAAMMAFCLYWRYAKRQMQLRDKVLMYGILILTASCKVIYFVVCGLILMIPNERFAPIVLGIEGAERDKKPEILSTEAEMTGTGGKAGKAGTFHKIVSMVVLAVFAGGWVLIAGRYLGTTRGGGDTAAKLEIILHSPVRYIYIMNKVFWDEGEDYLLQMLGSQLGATDVLVSRLLILVVLAGLLYLCLEEIRDRKGGADGTDTGLCLFMLAQSAAMIVLVFTSLYIQWTNIIAATYTIEGIQGRYFLPIAPVLVLGLLAPKRNGIAETKGEDERRNGNNEENTACEMLSKHKTDSAIKMVFMLAVVNLVGLLLIWSYTGYLG